MFYIFIATTHKIACKGTYFFLHAQAKRAFYVVKHIKIRIFKKNYATVCMFVQNNVILQSI